MIAGPKFTAPTLGLAVIARDEESTLPNLLASIEGAFDQVALLDTGSTDGTVEVFEDWAFDHGFPLGFKIGHFAWRDDFAAARNAANALLETDWLAWADCDDVIRGSQHLRGVVANTAPHTVLIKFKGGYIHGCGGRERIARRGFERWLGRVHEGQPANGAHWKPRPNGIFKCAPWDAVAWVHSSTGEANQRNFGPKYQRNMSIIERWMADAPGHPTPAAYRATEELSRGDRDTALGYFRDFLALPRVRRELGAERIETALTVLPTIEPGGQVNDYVLGKPPLSWLDDPAFANVPLCSDPGPALLDRRLEGAAA